ncbi:UNVERIFIED_CONTAM: hypothetical protein IGO34_29945, partial [Salmonella enterica subsp. enterica serovar Weltevreden]
ALSYDKGSRLVNTKIKKVLSNYAITKPIDIDLLLLTSLGKRQEPAVVVRVSSAHNTVSIGNSKITYNDVAFKGLILSLDSAMDKGNPEQ